MSSHPTPEDILARYTVCAEVLGREVVEADPDDPGAVPEERWAAYSLHWFYRHLASPEHLNSLSRAYLGDAAARRGLRFGEAERASFAGDLLESRYPLNERQTQAVARALASDLSLVQGPPGTGKTETILNMASCMVAAGSTVAVVANNGKAIDNITEKIEAWRREGEGALGPNQLRLTRAYAALGSKQKRAAWVEAHADAPEELLFHTGRRALDGNRLTEADQARTRRFETIGWEPRVRAADFLARHPFITSTVHSLKKCFADGDAYRFDYVIMDEASQCSPLLALVAMSSARHLVLVGDVEQLPPIYSEDLGAATAAELAERGLSSLEDAAFGLRDAETGAGTSIIASVERSLGDAGVPHTFLNEHYRCHPGIISFCDEQVYRPGGNALSVKTPSYEREVATPIRVRWFEGNYCEPTIMAPTAPRRGKRPPKRLTRTNARQVEIFMREEWPELRERLIADPALSVCVLSPYRGLLADLERRISEEGGLTGHAMGMEGTSAPADPTAARQIPTFTIHKSQGQEYDIVYLLPGEDGAWEWPWTEAKPLINVAVSRARRELVIIVSTCLMSPETQAALVGAERVVSPIENMAGELPEEERARRAERERFLQRLIDYVRDRAGDARPAGEPRGFPASEHAFGFHRSAIRSVFDAAPRIREELGLRPGASPSAPEIALIRAVSAMGLAGRGLTVRRELPVRACGDFMDEQVLEARWRALGGVRVAGEEVPWDRARVFLAGDSHFDLAIFEEQTGRAVLFIEVDGELHRAPRKRRDEEALDRELAGLAHRQENDRLKDAIAVALGGRVLRGNEECGEDPVVAPSFILLRLPTDGTTDHEVRALGAEAPVGRASIEDLLDEVARGRADAPALIVGDPSQGKALDLDAPAGPDARHPGITALLKAWRQEGEELPEDVGTAAAANRALVRAGLIEKVDGAWRATQAGRSAGIVESRERFRDAKTGRESEGTMLRYPPEAAAAVLEVLLRG